MSNQLIILAKKLKMKYLNVQFFYIDSKVIPFEFNGRLSGTLIMISKVFNVIELFIREKIFKEDINPQISEEIFIAMRYYSEVYTTPSKVEDILLRSENLFK
jgi:carbamoylphosphate synthase large subunit